MYALLLHQLKQKSLLAFDYRLFLLSVGMAGFEPTASSTPCWRDTGLRYIPFECLFSNNLHLQRLKAALSPLSLVKRYLLITPFRNGSTQSRTHFE
jgi:hypothetical protein